MWGPLVNRANRVPERQRMVQASTEPIYYRSYYGVFAFTMAYTTYGIYQLIRGKPATE